MSSDGMPCCEHAAMNRVMLLVCLNPSSRWSMRVMVPEQYLFINWQSTTPSRRASQKSFLSLSSPAELSTMEPTPPTATWLELELAPPLFPQTRSSLIKGCKRTSTSAHSFCASLRARCAGAFRNSLHRSEVAARITSRCSGVEGEIREAVEILKRFWVYAGVR